MISSNSIGNEKSNSSIADRWIGFDLDDVLANMRTPMCKSYSKATGQNVKIEDWTDYNFFLEKMSPATFLQMIIDDRILHTCQPEPDAAACIERLQSKGYKVAVVTARGYHPDAHGVTQNWLESHGMNVDSLKIVQPGQSKAMALGELPGLVAYVDDHLAHLESTQAAHPHVDLYLMARPWNQHDQKFKRLFTVSEYAEQVLSSISMSAKNAVKKSHSP